MSFDDDFTDIEKRRQVNFDDLNNELADRDTGRISRFFNDTGRDNVQNEQRKHADTVQLLTELQSRMQNPDYAAAHAAVSKLLGRAETATEAALANAESALADTIDSAARLPDGRAVFMDENGNAVTEDGEMLDAETAAGIEWPDNAPSYEEYLRRKNDVEELRRYQIDVLGRYRDRLNDPDNPPTLEELREWQRRIHEEAPEVMKPKLEFEQDESYSSITETLAVDKPTIS